MDKAKRTTKGYTLIEMSVSMVFVAALAVFGIKEGGRMMVNARQTRENGMHQDLARNALNQMTNDIRLASSGLPPEIPFIGALSDENKIGLFVGRIDYVPLSPALDVMLSPGNIELAFDNNPQAQYKRGRPHHSFSFERIFQRSGLIFWAIRIQNVCQSPIRS